MTVFQKLPATLLMLVLALAACTGEAPEPTSLTEGYDTFGEAITPVDAVPVQAVAMEAETLLGTSVKLEGRISEVCQGMGCWLTLQAVDAPLIRIDVPRDDDGNYVYTFPKDAAGRRAIVAGVLDGPSSHHEEGDEEHDEMTHHDDGDASHDAMHDQEDGSEGAMEGHDDRETEVMNATSYTLIASGALLERVRT